MTARPSPAAPRRHRLAWLMVALGLLRSRPLHERIVLALVVLAALTGLARENQTRNIARLVAWDQKQTLRQQRAVRARRVRAG